MTTSLDNLSGASDAGIAGSTWDELAKLDPLWIILHEPEKKHGRWRAEEFFSAGEAEVSGVLDKCAELGIKLKYQRALDFGCGVGRLTRAFALRFSQCVGVDVSGKMISLARDFNKHLSNCEFAVNHSDSLPFPDCSFDFVCSLIVLQHIGDKQGIEKWVQEFVRVLRPGGAVVFQLPDKPSLRRKIQGRRRLWSLLRFMGVRERFLFEKLGLTPIKMDGLRPSQVKALLENAGAEVVKVEEDHRAGAAFRSYLYLGRKKELGRFAID